MGVKALNGAAGVPPPPPLAFFGPYKQGWPRVALSWRPGIRTLRTVGPLIAPVPLTNATLPVYIRSLHTFALTTYYLGVLPLF